MIAGLLRLGWVALAVFLYAAGQDVSPAWTLLQIAATVALTGLFAVTVRVARYELAHRRVRAVALTGGGRR